jgi:hypothetical protein
MSARAKPRAWSGEDANARAVGVFVYDTETGWCSVTSLAVCCCRVSMRPAVVVHEGKKYGPQQAKMVMQSVADYSKQILKLQDEAIGKRRIGRSQSQQVHKYAGVGSRAVRFSERQRRKQGNGLREWSQGLCGVYGCLSATPIVIGVE